MLTASFNRTRLGDTINPEGAELVKHLQMDEPKIAYAIRFINHHELVLVAKDEVVSTGAMEYSFEHDRGRERILPIISAFLALITFQITRRSKPSSGVGKTSSTSR
jgi:hypothetical protein